MRCTSAYCYHSNCHFFLNQRKSLNVKAYREIIVDTAHITQKSSEAPHMSTREIFVNTYWKIKCFWYVIWHCLHDSLCMLTLFNLFITSKGFLQSRNVCCLLFFEWAAIPSTIFCYISDKFFKGHRCHLQSLQVLSSVYLLAGKASLFLWVTAATWVV